MAVEGLCLNLMVVFITSRASMRHGRIRLSKSKGLRMSDEDFDMEDFS